MTDLEALKTLDIAIAEVEWEYPMEYAVAFETAQSALRERIERNNGWISVEDRLPDKDKRSEDGSLVKYLVVVQKICGGFLSDHKSLEIAHFAPTRCFKKYFGIETKGIVTHWMPLPEPPKEDEDDNIM